VIIGRTIAVGERQTCRGVANLEGRRVFRRHDERFGAVAELISNYERLKSSTPTANADADLGSGGCESPMAG
jgi:hypothetical protein